MLADLPSVEFTIRLKGQCPKYENCYSRSNLNLLIRGNARIRKNCVFRFIDNLVY